MSLPASEATAFTTTVSSGSLVVATGDAPDAVDVSRGEQGALLVAVEGQELQGRAAGGCDWDDEELVLSCPSRTRLLVRLGAGNDALSVTGNAVVTAVGEGGDDELEAGLAGSVLTGGPGNDTLDGGEGADLLDGQAGTDTLDGGPGDDRVSGDVGQDSVDGGLGADVVLGGPDGDELSGGLGDDLLEGGDGQDIVDGGVGADLVRGGDGPDELSGDVGDDTLDGGGHDDELGGGLGVNRADGGSGNDVVELTGAAGDRGLGGDGDDGLDATEATGGVVLDGGAGGDELEGSRFSDGLSGGPGDDTLAGGGAGDALGGGPGLDQVSYEDAEGAVSVSVGTVADDGEPGEGDDVHADVEDVEGSDDDDLLVAGPGAALLSGGDGDDRLVGGPGPDRLAGDAGDDHLDGGPGVAADEFEGGDDDDTVSYARRGEPLRVDLSRRSARSGATGEQDRFVDDVEALVTGRGRDRIIGRRGVAHDIDSGPGADAVLVRERGGSSAEDGADTVRCSTGTDRVWADGEDEVAPSCERALVGARLLRPVVLFAGAAQRVQVRADGRAARLRLGCHARTRGRCSTAVLLRDPRTGRVLARGTARLAPGRTATVRLTAPAGARPRLLARATRVVVVVTARDVAGRRSVARHRMATRRMS